MLPTKLMKFIVHCSSPLNSELQFCRRSFLLSLKLCQNGFKTFKLIDPFLFWTNVALMHYLSSHFRLHLYLSLFQATSFLIIVFASTAEMCKKVLKFSKLPCNPDSKIKIFFFLIVHFPASVWLFKQLSVGPVGLLILFGGFQIV